jgi:hypothetical protein
VWTTNRGIERRTVCPHDDNDDNDVEGVRYGRGEQAGIPAGVAGAVALTGVDVGTGTAATAPSPALSPSQAGVPVSVRQCTNLAARLSPDGGHRADIAFTALVTVGRPNYRKRQRDFDSAGPKPVVGMNLRAMVTFGLTPYEALTTATTAAGDFLAE